MNFFFIGDFFNKSSIWYPHAVACFIKLLDFNHSCNVDHERLPGSFEQLYTSSRTLGLFAGPPKGKFFEHLYGPLNLNTSIFLKYPLPFFLELNKWRNIFRIKKGLKAAYLFRRPRGKYSKKSAFDTFQFYVTTSFSDWK